MSDIIPVIDFTAYSLDRAEPDLGNFEALIDDVHAALTTVGCLYLKNHMIPAEKIDDCFCISRAFFQLPIETKRAYPWSDKWYYGYRGMEDERLTVERKAKDLKENFNYVPQESQLMPDKELPEFRTVIRELFDVCAVLHNRLLEILARGLKLEDPLFFVEHHKMMQNSYGNMSALRTSRYPPLTDLDIKPDQIRCGEHTDLGSISIIFQDFQPGLEIWHDGRWISVPPKDGAVVVFPGETMQRWTVGRYKALIHRVVIPADSAHLSQPRQSIAFFGIPDGSASIIPIECSEKYPPSQRFDAYIANRIADNKLDE